MTILSLKEVSYEVKEEKEILLNNISIDFFPGKIYCILSKNSFEKSMLLSVIAGFDDCTSGSVNFEGEPIKNLKKEKYRGEKIGLIVQKNNFIPHFSVIENLALYTKIIPLKKISSQELYTLLRSVGIEKKIANTKVKNLSLLNQQKACLAKAIVKEPKIILVEEPTTTLNEIPLDVTINYLKNYAKSQNSCVIFLSKSNLIQKQIDELWGLNGGRLTFIKEQ